MVRDDNNTAANGDAQTIPYHIPFLLQSAVNRKIELIAVSQQLHTTTRIKLSKTAHADIGATGANMITAAIAKAIIMLNTEITMKGMDLRNSTFRIPRGSVGSPENMRKNVAVIEKAKASVLAMKNVSKSSVPARIGDPA